MGEWMYKSTFLTSVLVGGEWSASPSCRFTPGTHWIGGWVGPRTSLVGVEKRKFLTLQGLELKSRASQPVASRYTDYAVPAPKGCIVPNSESEQARECNPQQLGDPGWARNVPDIYTNPAAYPSTSTCWVALSLYPRH
jgi:hypothetical protein